ncbi:uncharacterized protein TNCV_4576131 [Trichonephila clavipes]|nr:uncharacterized protein TNCV_4576131 [Trichonephila clavipes]
MNKIRKTPAGLDCLTVSSKEFVAKNDDKVCTALIMADKDIWVFVQSSKNIIDADSDDESEINNSTLVPTSSVMRNTTKSCQDALFIGYKQSPDNAHSVAFSQRSSSPHLIVDETFNDSDIINNMIDYEDGQEEPDSLRVDKNMQGSSFPTNWKSIFLK